VKRAALGLALALVVAITGTAWACPAPPRDDPNWRCTKYDRFVKQLPELPVINVYVRDKRGALPKKKSRVMKHLTSSGWHARKDQGVQDKLQLFDASDVPDTYDAVDGARQLFVRGVDKHKRKLQVTLDDGVFTVTRCKERGHVRTCLVRQ